MTPVRFDAAARAEFLAETAYYARRQPDLGARFILAVEEAVARAVAFPRAGAPGPANTRRIRVRRFPFSLYYRVAVEEIVIFALAHHARRPNSWLQRLDDV